jgi:hypothetical protein
LVIYELMGRGGGDSELALSLERVGSFRGVEGISLVGGEAGRYLGTGSLDCFGRCGKANRKGGGVGLDWIGSLALGGRSEEAEL